MRESTRILSDAAGANPAWNSLTIAASVESIPIKVMDNRGEKVTLHWAIASSDLAGTIQLYAHNDPDNANLAWVAKGSPVSLTTPTGGGMITVDKEANFYKAVVTVTAGTGGDLTGHLSYGRK